MRPVGFTLVLSALLWGCTTDHPSPNSNELTLIAQTPDDPAGDRRRRNTFDASVPADAGDGSARRPEISDAGARDPGMRDAGARNRDLRDGGTPMTATSGQAPDELSLDELDGVGDVVLDEDVAGDGGRPLGEDDRAGLLRSRTLDSEETSLEGEREPSAEDRVDESTTALDIPSTGDLALDRTPRVTAPSVTDVAVRDVTVAEVTVGDVTVRDPSVASVTVRDPTIRQPTVRDSRIQTPSVRAPTVRAPSVREPSVGGR